MLEQLNLQPTLSLPAFFSNLSNDKNALARPSLGNFSKQIGGFASFLLFFCPNLKQRRDAGERR